MVTVKVPLAAKVWNLWPLEIDSVPPLATAVLGTSRGGVVVLVEVVVVVGAMVVVVVGAIVVVVVVPTKLTI